MNFSTLSAKKCFILKVPLMANLAKDLNSEANIRGCIEATVVDVP